MKKMLINEMALNFIERIESNKKSSNTIRCYKNSLKVFFEMMEEIRPEVSPKDIFDFNKYTVEDIATMKNKLENELGRKRTYINTIVATISSFYTYLRKEYEDICLVKNIGKMAGRLVEHRAETVFLEVEESKQLIKTVENMVEKKKTKMNEVKSTDVRNELIINLFLNTGLRGNELCSLEFCNIIEKDNYIRFFGKGRKERGLYITDKTMGLYRAWLLERDKMIAKIPPQAGHENRIFLSVKRTGISIKQVNRVIDSCVQEAGIDKHVTSHKLRHTVATAFLKEGDFSLREVADILGHSSVTTTQRYSHITDDNKRLTRTSNPIFN